MLGRSLTTVLVCLVALLILPLGAEARGRWTVTSATGQTMGIVTGAGSNSVVMEYGKVYRKGSLVGGQKNFTHNTFVAYYKPPAATHVLKQKVLVRYYVSGHWHWEFHALASGPTNKVGYVKRRGSRWVVFKKIDGRFRQAGSTARSCPMWLAAMGVYILDRHWK